MRYWFLIFFPLIALGEPPRNFPYQWQFAVDTEILKTTENFSNSGSGESLPSGGSLFYASSHFNLKYRSKKSSVLFAGLDYSYAKSTSTNSDRTIYGVPYIRAGWNQYKTIERVEFIPEVVANYALRPVDVADDEAILSDGASFLSLGLWSQAHFKKFAPYLFVGFNYLTEEMASPYILKLGTEFYLSSLTVYLEATYQAPLINDKFKNSPNSRWAVVNQVNGGSYKFYSVNPTFVEIASGLNFSFNRDWLGKVRMEYPLQGQRTYKGFNFIFSIAWSFGISDDEREVLNKPGTKRRGKEGKFKEKLEDEDQNLFE